jgi:hypothetical protein
MNKNNFNLCETGWNLYLAFASAIEDKLEKDAILELKQEYIEHRKTCEICTKPGPNFGEGERENGIR